MSNATNTSGVVVELQSRYPVVEFQPAVGTRQKFVSTVSSSLRPYRVGEVIEVVYLRSNPGSAVVAESRVIWAGPEFAAVFSVMLFVFGLLGKRGRMVGGPLRIKRFGFRVGGGGE